MTTTRNVLLLREDKYWKFVDFAFGDDGEIKNYPKCFLDCATWGISAESLERYCNPIKWSNLTADEKQECAIQAYQESKAKKIKLEVIAKRLGTNRQTLYEWVNKTNKPRAPLEQIVQSLKKSK